MRQYKGIGGGLIEIDGNNVNLKFFYQGDMQIRGHHLNPIYKTIAF